MKVQLLPSSIENGVASQRQRLCTFIVNDSVAIDAGSLSFSCSDAQRGSVRHIVLSHTHLDHIAGLPIFVDDLFATLTSPVQVHATQAMIDVLEANVFNWDVYPRFSELENEFGPVLEYRPFDFDVSFQIGSLEFTAIAVDHHGPSAGFIVRDGSSVVAFTGDTSATVEFWSALNREVALDAVFIECAFPDRLGELAEKSHHLSPSLLASELEKLAAPTNHIFVSNIKASYRDEVVDEIERLRIPNLEVLTVDKIYEFPS
ncbi:MAG TPA: 3',5'-cyclic-nucleotide phosphodiesterase [Pyrinomonadaceae bacterium]|nr:3',5'-cyclic-nucleotide phosphodiesterase [Pyrinomonadaceae bacterium]